MSIIIRRRSHRIQKKYLGNAKGDLEKLLEKCWKFDRDFRGIFEESKQAYSSIFRISSKLIRINKVCDHMVQLKKKSGVCK